MTMLSLPCLAAFISPRLRPPCITKDSSLGLMRIIDNAAISRRVCFDVSTHRNGPQMHNRTEVSLTPAPSAASVPKDTYL